jgi:hypothetical protein
MFSTNKLHPVIRYPLAVIMGILAGMLFLGLTVCALKLGEWIISVGK